MGDPRAKLRLAIHNEVPIKEHHSARQPLVTDPRHTTESAVLEALGSSRPHPSTTASRSGQFVPHVPCSDLAFRIVSDDCSQ